MKKALTIFLLFSCCTAFAQDTLQYYNHQRYSITNTGMKVLGGWGIANAAVGGVGWATSSGQTKYFYQMNTIWGAVNLGAAILGYSGAQKEKGKPLNAEESLLAQRKIERIFLVNGVLDVVYIGTGVFVNHRGNVKNDDKLKGYGSSVIMQGAFLLLFDSIMYGAHKGHGNKLQNFLAKNPVTFSGNRVGMLIKL